MHNYRLDRCHRTLDRTVAEGYTAAVDAQQEWLDDFWANADIEIDGQPVGSMVSAKSGAEVKVSISVQSPLWFDVDRVEVYRDGRIIKVWESCQRTPDDPDCITLPNKSVDNLLVAFSDTPTQDSWYVVTAMGVRGKDLAPVYSSIPTARFGFVEATNSLFNVIPLGSLGGKTAREPSVHRTIPYAMTNTIRVDVGGVRPLPRLPAVDGAHQRHAEDVDPVDLVEGDRNGRRREESVFRHAV